jgi:hypothetical protein
MSCEKSEKCFSREHHSGGSIQFDKKSMEPKLAGSIEYRLNLKREAGIVR